MKFTSKHIRKLTLGLLAASCSMYATAQSQTHQLVVSPKTPTCVRSIGTELDPFFFSCNIPRNDGAKAEDWDNIVARRVKAMNVQSLRVMVLPQWFEPQNDDDDPNHINWDGFDFQSPDMQSVYKVLDLAEKEHMKVTIVIWGASPQHFLAEGSSGGWMIAPTHWEEWCENFSALIQYLQKKKKYSCIKEITPMNEPDWSFVVKGKIEPPHEYVKLCRMLDERFKKDGIRNKVQFNLSDNSDGNTGTHSFLKACTDSLGDIADVFNSHTYIFGYETPNSAILEWERENVRLAASCNKKHFIGEFGGNQCVGASRQKDIDLYERGVLMTRIVINLLNAGASGVSYWSLIDQYYGNPSYQAMQQLGLWKYVKEAYKSEPYYDQITCDYEVRPQYYAYSLLTRLIRPGAQIYPITTSDEWYAGTAVRNKDKKWVYAFANANKEARNISINNQFKTNKNKHYQVYTYEQGKLPESDKMIAARSIQFPADGRIELTLPANSVVFLQEK